MGIGSIERESAKARRVFESNREHLGEVYFGDFPLGACGSACCFLSQWLESKGLAGIRYIWGERAGRSHAWLEVNDCIVDITADQFSDGPAPVFVGCDRSFHDQFENQQEGDSSIPPVLHEAFRRFWELMQSA